MWPCKAPPSPLQPMRAVPRALRRRQHGRLSRHGRVRNRATEAKELSPCSAADGMSALGSARRVRCVTPAHTTIPAMVSMGLPVGLTSRSCAHGRPRAACNAWNTRPSPARPAAGSVCPTLALPPEMIAPVRSTPRDSAASSVGSPSFVPVPCASTASKRRARARASTRATNPACAAPLGAVRLALRPS